MANIKGKVETAIDKAAQVERIGFSEFTTKLVTDIFDALVRTNISQMEAYVEFAKNIQGSVTDFVNNIKDEVSGVEIFEFLENLGIAQPKIQTLQNVQDPNNITLSQPAAPATLLLNE